MVFLFVSVRGDAVVAADNAVERAVKTDQQDGELERLLSAIEPVLAIAHARDCGPRQTQDSCEHGVLDRKPVGSAKDSLREKGGFVRDRVCVCGRVGIADNPSGSFYGNNITLFFRTE